MHIYSVRCLCRRPWAATAALVRSGKPSHVRFTSTNMTPRQLPISIPIEEESLPNYVAEKYYPARIGQVLDSRYRILCKLGCGTGSTVWLARDQTDNQYRALKICTVSKDGALIRQAENEIATIEHLKYGLVQQHPGREILRLPVDSFDVYGTMGSHKCLVYSPLGMTFTELRNILPENTIPLRMLQHALQLVLLALDYLHKNQVIHTDISPNNILCGVTDTSAFEALESAEAREPIARKVLPDRTIYLSRQTPTTQGEPVLSDLGSARFGKDGFSGDIMPLAYRAPEVILDMEWSYKVDIWSMGVMVFDLVEGRRLFLTRGAPRTDEQHLAELVALLGPPPLELLQRSPKCAKYFDDSGNWLGSTPIPSDSLEQRVTLLEGEDKELALAFVRRALQWLPEERPTAEEFAYDDWLMQAYFEARNARAE